MTSPPNRSASETANVDLPEAVGPRMTTSGARLSGWRQIPAGLSDESGAISRKLSRKFSRRIAPEALKNRFPGRKPWATNRKTGQATQGVKQTGLREPRRGDTK